ncbi:Hpt domain-containing protein [Marichromatium sp. AB32]|uniref:HPt (Histidine-containing phosphotransfer) domain-containing protein n=1 Tax=Marichromatium gracile TaxID=1048 RepID=A0A4R4A6Q5_MARGR|nr:Hpt domain-containing protein [Marichromatium gracile]MBO8084683.1 Hpt domain-containing protein [Marichromatium sp.]RNE89217.1 Hpt domain-containing protein [Marichromatium sp. AB31]RNE93561.1 Hpt domain-containing protein [Marichromatium sp. AB32]MBK1708580.1 phosphorelay protein [Marichromatium gracile]TCW34491.1 HPt (histidine-containing phosphotransfer) domain-containing protein [Marichromatium gracile]
MPTPAPAQPLRDPAAALASVGGDAELAHELFCALRAELPAELEALRACRAESDWPGLADYVHQMRTVIRYCGVPALDAALDALERAARIGDALRIDHDIEQVATQAGRLSSMPDRETIEHG